MNATLAAEISRLTPSEKILLVEEIWDQVAASPETLPIPEWHRAELDLRLDAAATDPGRPWSEVRDEILNPLRNMVSQTTRVRSHPILHTAMDQNRLKPRVS